MKKIDGFEKVEEAKDFAQISPGPQIVKIVAVEDKVDKEYLKIDVDIAQGEMKGEFQRRKDQFNADNWPNMGVLRRSYKPNALPFFKRFVVAVEKSNDGFKFDFDEQKLVGKYFVANFGIEEYDNGEEVKETVKIQEARSIQSFKDGKVKPPKEQRLDKKVHEKYEGSSSANDMPSADETDFPF